MKQTEVVRIKSEYLSVDPITKRETYDPKILAMLEEDIAKHGFREEHPLVVRPNPKKRGHWLITCGQHRFEAGLRAGTAQFPCVKKEFQDDIHAVAEAYRDNTLACPVDAVTEAEYFDTLGRRMMRDMGHTDSSIDDLERKYPVERIALQMGVTKQCVSHRLRLLSLPEIVKWMIRRYYMPSERGYKISPAVGEELYRVQNILKRQKDAKIVTDLNVKREMANLAVKFWREKITLEEARDIAKEIAYQGYDKWKDKKIVVDKDGVRCSVCGEKIPDGDYPWTPLCARHKHEVLTSLPTLSNEEKSKSLLYYNSKGKGRLRNGLNIVTDLKPNPNVPLHEIDPKHHKLRTDFREMSR